MVSGHSLSRRNFTEAASLAELLTSNWRIDKLTFPLETPRKRLYDPADFRNRMGAGMKSSIFIVTLAALFLLASCGSSSGPMLSSTPASGEWTWVSGANVANQNGTYGTQDMAAASNIPGARSQAATWIDAAGNFWLFGGGYNVTALGFGYFNDLWKYSAGQWTWMGGSNAINQEGMYGTPGIAAAGNIPGARRAAIQWTDSAGNFWLFGGNGYDSVGTLGSLNDLWKYSAGEWTWMGGSNIANQIGTYGISGMAAAGNTPGSRDDSISWTDASGNFWLFGGYGYDSEGTLALLNDLWKYSAGEWTWVGGSSVANQIGIYGNQNAGAAANIPGARNGAVRWTDASGNFWLFGGYGYDSAGTDGYLNDLWKYSSGNWVWMGGSDVANQSGSYGTQGVGASGNVPGARYCPVGWVDTSRELWLFSGLGYGAAAGITGRLNDVWKYSGGQWTWMSGPDDNHQNGAYGTQGTAASGNSPGSRYFSVTWTDAAGNFWLFGGNGFDSVGTVGVLNDLWKYEP
jgi:N-acetylneuraminic acid mutarotase